MPMQCVSHAPTVWLTIALLTLLATAGGCGAADDGPERAIVTGKVSYDGRPVENGEIRFVPADGTTGPVSGGPIRDGMYRAEGRGGVPLGTHRVEIQAFRPDPQAAVDPLSGDRPAEQYLPEKYNRNSTLEATVEAGGEQTIDFNLDP